MIFLGSIIAFQRSRCSFLRSITLIYLSNELTHKKHFVQFGDILPITKVEDGPSTQIHLLVGSCDKNLPKWFKDQS